MIPRTTATSNQHPSADRWRSDNSATILAGGARASSNGQEITNAQDLSGSGGFTKLCVGILTLRSVTGCSGS